LRRIWEKTGNLPASLFKKLLDRKPFQKRLERKSLLNLKRYDGMITNLLKKRLNRNPFEKRLDRKPPDDV
jgi:hypothetical protein